MPHRCRAAPASSSSSSHHTPPPPLPPARAYPFFCTQLENVLIAGDGSHRLCDFGSVSTRSGPIADKMDRIREEDIIQRFTTAVYRWATTTTTTGMSTTHVYAVLLC
jgi:hypothetical protein